jgi:hypothetical protein
MRRGVSPHCKRTNLISIENYRAEFCTTDARGRKEWHPCRVVGVAGDVHDLKFVIIIDGEVEYADTAPEVRRIEPAPA